MKSVNYSLLERSHSGLVRTLGKRVKLKLSGVRIPLSPPAISCFIRDGADCIFSMVYLIYFIVAGKLLRI